MKKITWRLSRKQKKNINRTDRKLLIEGSAGSGKTIYAVHKVLKYGLEHKNARIGVFRDTLPALKATSWLELREALENYGIPFYENKNEGIIRLPTGSTILFKPLDDLKKIRSLNLDFVWVEQAEEISFAVFAELEKRIRGIVSKKSFGQFLLTVTPEGTDHWIYNYFHRQKRGTILHFHYTENPFLPEEYVKEYEELKEIDIELYYKYTLGKWGKLSNIVFENWDEQPPVSGVEKWTAGVDFGYNNPSCFLLIGWYDGEPYIVREVYKRRLTNPEFIDEIIAVLNDEGLTPGKLDKVYCDAAEPDRIEEFCQQGFDAVPGVKDVAARLETNRSVQIHISPGCVETKREIKNYKYQKDKDGNILDKPVDFKNHAMDAMGYDVYGVLGPLSKYKKQEIEEEDAYVY
ncbi:PBSX family phage terminase large subunit [Methanobacterium formicicum]|uniref:PBSX family phage terminase large subunit n=1 Tax=Methanobacterium formicicum TaxID=2162 RepID=UPI00241279FE|nr:PBSX family phage terminase large subunit [Methanobacterium formicicum]MDG3546592.1 PBSX family phage terminase large subunit [Methanobacterium formicicum]